MLIRDLPAIKRVTKALPDTWTNDANMKCDVMFLWEGFDRKDVPASDHLAGRSVKPDQERDDQDRRHDLYKGMTIRNCNTVRQLAEMMEAAES